MYFLLGYRAKEHENFKTTWKWNVLKLLYFLFHFFKNKKAEFWWQSHRPRKHYLQPIHSQQIHHQGNQTGCRISSPQSNTCCNSKWWESSDRLEQRRRTKWERFHQFVLSQRRQPKTLSGLLQCQRMAYMESGFRWKDCHSVQYEDWLCFQVFPLQRCRVSTISSNQ